MRPTPNPFANSIDDAAEPEGGGATELRRDLATALRWADRFGLGEGVCNHFSVALGDGDTDRFLVNPRGVHWREVSARCLVACSATGRSTPPPEVEPTAFFIHRQLHARRPEHRALLHTHMPAATALFCLADVRLEMISQNAIRFHDRVRYVDDYRGLVLGEDEAGRIVDAATVAGVVVLRHHGVVAAGPTLAEAFDDLYYFERACEVQLRAMSTGRVPGAVDAGVVATTAAQFAVERPEQARLFLRSLRRLEGDGRREGDPYGGRA